MELRLLQRQLSYNAQLIHEIEGFIHADKCAARNMKMLGRDDFAEDYYKSIHYWKAKLAKIVEMQKGMKKLLKEVE